jgi:hypothetical protein
VNSKKDVTEDEGSMEDGGYKNFVIESSTKNKSNDSSAEVTTHER